MAGAGRLLQRKDSMDGIYLWLGEKVKEQHLL